MLLNEYATLPDGTKVPRLAFGTATRFYKKPCTNELVQALNLGFRHMDTAQAYQNETSVGEALKVWGGKREDVFITTKWGTPFEAADPVLHLRQALKEVGCFLDYYSQQMDVEYVDLYLFHCPDWPLNMTMSDAWAKMEKLRDEGLCRSIGVSNFDRKHLEEIGKTWRYKPSVNSIQYHPYCAHLPQRSETVEWCKKNDIAIMPFSTLVPLTHSLDGPADPVVQRICEKEGMTPAQVLMLWATQNINGPIVTTTARQDRMEEFFGIFSVHQLDEDEIRSISEVGKKRAYWRNYND